TGNCAPRALQEGVVHPHFVTDADDRLLTLRIERHVSLRPAALRHHVRQRDLVPPFAVLEPVGPEHSPLRRDEHAPARVGRDRRHASSLNPMTTWRSSCLVMHTRSVLRSASSSVISMPLAWDGGASAGSPSTRQIISSAASYTSGNS